MIFTVFLDYFCATFLNPVMLLLQSAICVEFDKKLLVGTLLFHISRNGYAKHLQAVIKGLAQPNPLMTPFRPLTSKEKGMRNGIMRKPILDCKKTKVIWNRISAIKKSPVFRQGLYYLLIELIS
jgi:hypothetical protein